MKCMDTLGLRLLVLASLVVVVELGCGSEPPAGEPASPPSTAPAGQGGSRPGAAGATGTETGGSGGAPSPTPTAGSGGAGAGGGSGSAGSGGAAGSPVDAAPSDGPTPPPANDGGTAAPPAGTCSVTPAADAAMLKLAFKNIPLPGLAGGGSGKSPAGLTEIRFLASAPDQFLVAQKGGGLTHYRLEGDVAALIRAYRIPGVYAQADCGFISFAVDPNFKENRFVYAGYCTAVNRSKLTRFTLGETLADPVDILSFDSPSTSTAWHSVGSIGFDPGGALWMLHGEFTGGGNAQNLNSPLGKLLRMIPRPGGGADPAPGNAFPPGTAGRNPLVYAYGLRSPWRGYLDSRGRYLVGDVGDTTAEELNLVSKAGENFGWATRSGPCNGCGQVNPLSTYRISNDPYVGEGNEVFEAREGRAIWVGVQYQDCGTDRYGGALTGVYIFGDIYAGWVRAALIDDTGKKTLDRHLADFTALSAWTQAADGYLYALKFGAYGTGGLANEPQGLFRVLRAP
jgi:hypothetical protein